MGNITELRAVYIVQRNPTECGVSECDREASTMKRPGPLGATVAGGGGGGVGC
jgi:hypothetical protein